MPVQEGPLVVARDLTLVHELEVLQPVLAQQPDIQCLFILILVPFVSGSSLVTGQLLGIC